MRDMVDKKLCAQALDNVDRSIAITLRQIAAGHSPDVVADLCQTLDRLDVGKLLLEELSSRTGTSIHI